MTKYLSTLDGFPITLRNREIDVLSSSHQFLAKIFDREKWDVYQAAIEFQKALVN
jgi:hypothetical protein